MKKITITAGIMLMSISINAQTYPRYIPTVDPDVYRELLKRNDDDYQENVAIIKKRSGEVNKTINTIPNLDDRIRINKQLNEFLNKLNDNGYDYSDVRVYKWVMKNFDIIEQNASNLAIYYYKSKQ